MPSPLQVACAGDDACSATLPAGLWLYGFTRDFETERAEAARFLNQASFGASTDDVTDFLDVLGGDPTAYLAEQMALPASKHRDYFRARAYPPFDGSCAADGPGGTYETLGKRYAYYVDSEGRRYSNALDVVPGSKRPSVGNNKGMVMVNLALNADDQLRQRVAWALSQIYIVSAKGSDWQSETEIYVNYYDIFVRHAFGNLRDLLVDISYSPMMADYLTYRGNAQYDGARFPDENYAREFMQLFTIGLYEMNADGTFAAVHKSLRLRHRRDPTHWLFAQVHGPGDLHDGGHRHARPRLDGLRPAAAAEQCGEKPEQQRPRRPRDPARGPRPVPQGRFEGRLHR